MPDECAIGPVQADTLQAQGAEEEWVPPTPEHLGRLMSHYEVERIIGYGGMGAVYKGRQKSLDRAVAIKVLQPRPDMDGTSFAQRFKNEARIMARFMHGAIVGVFDFGETSEGHFYIVMEFVDGTDVQKMIQSQGHLPPEHALAIAAHVCDALKYAHEHGVIHRDIKPGNILINTEGEVKVADFGLSKAGELDALGASTSGTTLGTPDFVAPEALIMDMEIDHRVDLYSLGVTLYSMLTGKVPGRTWKPPSSRWPGIDPRFDHIVLKAMQENREERYQSAAAIRRDLDVILSTPVVKAGEKTTAAVPKESARLPHELPPPMIEPGEERRQEEEEEKRQVHKEIARQAPAPSSQRRGGREHVERRRRSNSSLASGVVALAGIVIGAFMLSRGGKLNVGGDAGVQTTAIGEAKSDLAVTKTPAPPKLAASKSRSPKPSAAAPKTDEPNTANVSIVKPVLPGLNAVAATSPPSAAPKPGTPSIPAAVLAATDGFTNTLGMKFVKVPVADVLLCIHETRYKDYAAFAAETEGVDGSWKDQTAQGYTITERAGDHPVTNVCWEDAQRFCAWLSKKEGRTYRLPMDREWTSAAALAREEIWTEHTTPATVVKDRTEFPWGNKWPPPKGAGNYSDESRKAKALAGSATYLDRYKDGYPITAPVMSFQPNTLGLYDLGGNVCEWCADWYDGLNKDRVLRGGCWLQYERGALLSSHRYRSPPNVRTKHCGFRLALVPSGSEPIGAASLNRIQR